MPWDDVMRDHVSKQFWILASFLVIACFTGGSARGDVQSLQVLRPAAILVAAYGLFTIRWRELGVYKGLVFLIVAVFALVAAHLIFLPPSLWSGLPGRAIIRDIDAMAELAGLWRPLSMAPLGTLNALYALSIPLAVFVLAVQLREDDHVRLLGLLIVLAMISGSIGLLQAIGIDIQVYALSPATETAGLFANRNHQGVLLAMLFPMLVVFAKAGNAVGLRRNFSVILAVALAIVAVPLIIVTGSRAGLIASLIALLMTPVVNFHHSGRRKAGSQRRLAAQATVGAAAVAGLVWLTIFTSRETALVRFEGVEGDIRYPVWSSIADALHVYLPWGSGIGSYADVYQILEPDSLLRPTFSNHAHNEWLEIALTAGLPGLAILGFAAMLFLRASWQAAGAAGISGALKRLGLVLILLLAFASTFDYPVRTPIMASVLVIAAVWASSIRSLGKTDAC